MALETNGGQPVRVPIGACRCPGRPHPEGDWVDLSPTVSLELGLASQGAIAIYGDDAIELQTALGRAFVRYGVIAWNVLGPEGRTAPLSPAAIEARLGWTAGGREVADAAADLYAEAVLAPFGVGLPSGPPPGQTDPSISPSPRSGQRSPSSRRLSSRSTPEAGT